MVKIDAYYRNKKTGKTVQVCGVNELEFRQVVFSPFVQGMTLDVAMFRPEPEFLQEYELVLDSGN